jgi:ribonucleoside-diphosphate reductase alpha chain
MPNEVKMEDIQDAYEQSWKMGIKANAIYRDGCKLSQPLNTSKKKETVVETKIEIKEVEITKRALRHKLNAERQSITHKFAIAGHEGYFTVGLYDDGSPGEIFIKMNKEGSTLSGIMDALALSISLNLQYGVPLEVLISKFTHTRFEPSGMTSNREIPMVKSIMDYLGRWLAVKFMEKENAKKYHNGQLVDKAYNEGTMSRMGALPNIHKIISLSELELKNVPKETESQLIENLEKIKIQEPKKAVAVGAAMSTHLHGTPKAFQNDDAPMCSNCGASMIRNGTCYKCLDCGETSGCS